MTLWELSVLVQKLVDNPDVDSDSKVIFDSGSLRTFDVDDVQYDGNVVSILGS